MVWKVRLLAIANSQCMREGYSSRFVCVCVCPAMTSLASTYLVCKSQVGVKVPYGISNARIVQILIDLCMDYMVSVD